MTNAKIVAIEIIALVIIARALFGMIVDRIKAPMPSDVLAKGWMSLAPHYRRKVDRTIGGMLRRFKLAVEVWVRQWIRRQLMA